MLNVGLVLIGHFVEPSLLPVASHKAFDKLLHENKKIIQILDFVGMVHGTTDQTENSFGARPHFVPAGLAGRSQQIDKNIGY